MRDEAGLMAETYGELKTRCCQLRDELAWEKGKLTRVRDERDVLKAELERVKAALAGALADMKEYGAGYGFTCEVCAHIRGIEGNPCHYPANVDVDDRMCRECDRCPCGRCDGVSRWEWRGAERG